MNRSTAPGPFDRFPAGTRWAEVASGLADGIETGRYVAGESLGTIEELTFACCVGRKAMRRALLELAATGYVTRRGRYHVADNPPRRNPG